MRFTKIKLVGQTKLYWVNQERMMIRGHHNPVINWLEMKEILKEKYVPITYRQRMLYQWQRLSQGTKLVSEYISKFDELLSHCDLQEDESVVLSCFRVGLKMTYNEDAPARSINSLAYVSNDIGARSLS